MTRKDDLKAAAAEWLTEPEAAAELPEASAPKPKPKRSASGPASTTGKPAVILATDKSRTPGGLLRRTTYFTPAEWGAVLERAEAETRETGKLVTAAEIVRRAVWDYLTRDLDA